MFAGASDFFQSKSSILKKAGAASKAKKVHFDTMKTKSWSSSNASKKKKQSPPKEAPHCSTGVASLPATEVFEVEAIQDHKKVADGSYLYFLKWKGYSEEDNTWEPSSNLFCTSILDAYRRKHNLVAMSSLEEARSSLTKYSRTNRHKRSSKHRSEAMSVDGVNGFLSGQLLSKRKKRKRRLSEWDPWSVKEALVQLKKGESAVQELIVSIRLDTGVTVSQYCHKELSHGSGNVLGSEAIDIIDITRSSDESLVDEVLPNRSDAVHSTASGMNGFHRGYGSSKSNRDLPSAQSDSSCNHPPLVSAKHRLSCLKHDHPYSKQLCSKTLPSILPSILTSPTSAEPCEELSFSTQTTDVGNVTISPPPTPVDNSQHSSRIDRYFELHSPQPQAMNDYPQSNSPIPPSPLSTAFKLQWSSASSVSSDFEVCNEVSPLTTKPGQETKDRLHLTTYRGRKLYKPSRMSLNSGWRKGPVPLPRSFSKRHSSASLLQTKAAKQKSVPSASYQSNDLDSKSYLNDSEIKIKKFSLSLKRGFERIKSKKLMNALAPFIANDENHFDQVFPSEDIESVDSHARSDRDSLEYTSLCTYKELLMDWQYELNKQRDGTDDIIYVENNLDMTAPPTDFNYVCSNVYAAGVPNPSNPDLSSSLCGCECYYLGRKCGPKSEFCCAHMAGSRFAYTPAGKVKVPPGTPIYECNTKCSCPSDCSNRIVQLGRKIPLCIFRAEGRGWGVKTTEPIKPNTFVTEYVGEVITNEEAEKRGKKCDAQGITYLFDLDFEDDNSAFTVDAARYGNISHFFNHSCDPNLVVYSVWIDTLDKRLPRLAFFTTRSISTGEELTFDYQMNRSSDSTSGPKMPCLCGSKNCLGYIN